MSSTKPASKTVSPLPRSSGKTSLVVLSDRSNAFGCLLGALAGLGSARQYLAEQAAYDLWQAEHREHLPIVRLQFA
ncbi:hypothetical protein PEC302107_31690 [Pectobacterium araliae]|uniref:hypothetical protein n=1 Tax=Pectobacterium araliae TaxID=3073862 RepID=UPI0020823A4E|nr:hypothetical protein PEC302107_31690 [Pectobacterium carotovorum subsp. carotovorum]